MKRMTMRQFVRGMAAVREPVEVWSGLSCLGTWLPEAAPEAAPADARSAPVGVVPTPLENPVKTAHRRQGEILGKMRRAK